MATEAERSLELLVEPQSILPRQLAKELERRVGEISEPHNEGFQGTAAIAVAVPLH